MKITITKQEFMAQLDTLDHRFKQPEIIQQQLEYWDELTGSASVATLYMRGFRDSFGCHMGSTEETGFFNFYLPISPECLRQLT